MRKFRMEKLQRFSPPVQKCSLSLFYLYLMYSVLAILLMLICTPPVSYPVRSIQLSVASSAALSKDANL
jgi:hypothetical protein